MFSFDKELLGKFVNCDKLFLKRLKSKTQIATNSKNLHNELKKLNYTNKAIINSRNCSFAQQR